MQFILSYLSKEEQKTQGVICQLSDIPAPPAAGSGQTAEGQLKNTPVFHRLKESAFP